MGVTTYMTDWCEISGKNSRQLTLIILIAQNPIIITAGKLINLSLVNFLTVRINNLFLHYFIQYFNFNFLTGYSYVRSLFQSLAKSYGMKLKIFMSES